MQTLKIFLEIHEIPDDPRYFLSLVLLSVPILETFSVKRKSGTCTLSQVALKIKLLYCVQGLLMGR